MRICIILNPAARGEKANRLRHRLAELGGGCAVQLTESPGAGRALATEAVNAGFETIVAAGGDGTVNEVLNGIADHPEGCARVRLGVLPVGTVNVFARELGLPGRVESAWEIVVRGHEASIDLPRMQFEWQGTPQNRHFVQMAGAGWDACAIERVNWSLKKRIGQYAYMVAGLKMLRHKRPVLTVSDGTHSFQGELVILGNGRFYGGEIPVFHRANNCDGQLDVCVFPKISVWVLLRYVLGFLSPRWYRPGNEAYFQAASLELRSGQPCALQLDGETVGQLPACSSIQPRSLRVIVP